ncbi:Ribonuclease H2 subunit A, partial [Sarcoptes scabiei]
PMIYSAAYCPFSIQKIIDKEKFQDSKTLTETQRRSMFTEIDNFEDIGWLSTILPPTLISTSMLKRCKYNLNQLSQDTAINLIQDLLDDGVRIQEVYVDTVGVPEKYEALLRRKFPSIKKIKVSKKADSLFKIVSIASICAKVLRDFIVENWKFIEKIDFDHLDYGSGYPSDPKTKEYLTKIFDPIFGYPQFVRFSWSTITKILEEKAVPCRWDDDDDDDDANPNNSNEKNKVKNHKISKQKSIDTFFAPKNHTRRKRKSD